MKRTIIEIEFPDIYSKEEIINEIFSQVNIDNLKKRGIQIFISKDLDWFN